VSGSGRRCKRCRAFLARDRDDAYCGPCAVKLVALRQRPPAVTAEFWNDPHVLEAIAERHMGHVIAAYRTHPEHGHPISQEIVGMWALRSQGQISKIENGRGETDIRVLQAWASLLDVPTALLWFAMPDALPNESDRQESSPLGGLSFTSRMVTRERDTYSSVNGGNPDAKAVAADGGAATAFDGEPPPVFRPSSGPSGSAVAAQADGEEIMFRRDYLRAAAIGAGIALGIPLESNNKFGLSDLDLLRKRTVRLRQIDNILGGGDTFSTYISEYRSTKFILRECAYSDTVRRGLLILLAEQAQQAGWAAFDAGDHEKAAALYKISESVAMDAGDSGLAGNALAFLAYQRIHEDPAAAVRLATASCEIAGTAGVGSVGALLHERRAWAHAIAGNADETARALDAAQEALQVEDPTGGPDWAAWVDESELSIMAGRCWTELRRPLRAVPRLRTVLDGFSDAHARDKALYMSWLADAYLIGGEVEEAAAVAGRSLDLSAGIASVRPRVQLERVLRGLAKHSELAPVAQVLEKARH
jgi:tetratricopeptide (TPR) repeat protein